MLITKFAIFVLSIMFAGSVEARKHHCKATDGAAIGQRGKCLDPHTEPCVGIFSSSKECKGKVPGFVYCELTYSLFAVQRLLSKAFDCMTLRGHHGEPRIDLNLTEGSSLTGFIEVLWCL
jgi:hypothetical protein